jgi:hypothetical protein
MPGKVASFIKEKCKLVSLHWDQLELQIANVIKAEKSQNWHYWIQPLIDDLLRTKIVETYSKYIYEPYK